MNKNEPDLNSLLKVQDIIDVLYKINRIKDNSYDQNLNMQLNNMQPVDKAQNIIKYISQNSDPITRENADILIKLLRSVNEVNYNRNINIKSNKNNRNCNSYKNSTNQRNYPNNCDDNLFDKIKKILKSLNDE